VLLLVGYAAALRRSELVALDAGDLIDIGYGLQVFVARSKADQAALGDFIGVAPSTTRPTAASSPARSGPGHSGATR